MSKLREKLSGSLNPESLKTDINKVYDFKKNLNWRDDGDELCDPSVNDFLKGYQIDPYDFKQWASNKHGIEKTAAEETDVLHFTPEYLADKILTLWNGTDGPLQNFFDAFTLRYPNKLTQEVAAEINKLGYEVFPELIDDKPRYAFLRQSPSAMQKFAQYNKIFKDALKNQSEVSVHQCLAYLKNNEAIFSNSEGFKKFAEEIENLKNDGVKTNQIDMQSILSYYEQIFPEDFAIALTADLLSDGTTQTFKDYNLSDESLNKIEDYMSGNANPIGDNFGAGKEFGYDNVTQTNSDISVPATTYETRVSSKKKDRN